jgi:hypothetical protein
MARPGQACPDTVRPGRFAAIARTATTAVRGRPSENLGDHLRPGRALPARGSQDAAGTGAAHPAAAGGVLHPGGVRDPPVGDRLRAGQPGHVADRRLGRLRHAHAARGPVPAAVGAVGGRRRFPAHGRRRAGRHPHGPVRLRRPGEQADTKTLRYAICGSATAAAATASSPGANRERGQRPISKIRTPRSMWTSWPRHSALCRCGPRSAIRSASAARTRCWRSAPHDRTSTPAAGLMPWPRV